MGTDFEGRTHGQLLAMIATLDPETVKARATQLTHAAATIGEIGEGLKKHRVEGWEGEAAQAFRDWASRAGNATLRLSEYGAEGARWLTEAAQTMVEVRANTPAYDTTAAANLASARAFPNDPDAHETGLRAHTKLTDDHERAIQQLTKLAQSYELSATQLTRAEIPTFPPPPGVFVPPERDTISDRARPGGGSAHESYSASSAYPASGSGAGRSAEMGAVSGSLSSHGVSLSRMTEPTSPLPSALGRETGMVLDHVATLPDRTTLPTAHAAGGTEGIGATPLTLPPSVGLAGSSGGALPGVTPSSTGGTRAGTVGGTSSPSPRDTGIVGGRPISPSTSSGAIPRGTVIGADATHAVGRGIGGVSGPSGTPGGPSGRRLAMESGGVVGTRQSAVAGQPFTQGGSGLVRSGMVSGAIGPSGVAAQPPAGRRGDQRGRPDYLSEDDETWQGSRRVVPPVID
ncbi:hypothetical protein ABZZ17_13330 [Streptomyces sp. NPDC006512]|uniref:WXG100 family type VII secretion target n=1 Tax=Streptomyces sp. NPDC006512 TaxID=3154307 RepID=UPI0033A42CA8